MKRIIGLGIIFVGFLAVGLIAGPPVFLKVKVQTASVRAKPDMQSNIIRKLDEGTLLEAQKKVGDWYEVALQTDVGISVVGYIHEMFVEVETAEEEKTKEKEAVEQKAAEPELETSEKQAPRLEPAPASKLKGLVLTFSGNISMNAKVGDSTFSRTPTYSYMEVVRDNGTLTMSRKPTVFGGQFGIGYFFSDMFGLYFTAAYLPKSSIDIKSAYTYTWKFPSYAQNSDSTEWTSTGSVSSIPLSLDLCLRFRLAQRSLLTIQAGGTLFLTNADLQQTKTGYGVASQSTYQIIIWPYIYTITTTYADWYLLDIKAGVRQTIFGGNIGFEFEQMVGPSVGLIASARYYFAPEQEYVWELIPAAKYEGQFGNLSRTIASDQSNLPELPQIVTKVNFSQFGFFIGVKIHL